MNQEDKRKYPRVRAVHLFAVDSATGEPIEGFNLGGTLDMSRSGIGLEMSQELPAGTNLIVEIAVKERIVSARCEVVYCLKKNNGMVRVGTAFKEIDPDDLDVLLGSGSAT